MLIEIDGRFIRLGSLDPVTVDSVNELYAELTAWCKRALAAEAKLRTLTERIEAEYQRTLEANQALDRAAAEDAALVEQFNG